MVAFAACCSVAWLILGEAVALIWATVYYTIDLSRGMILHRYRSFECAAAFYLQIFLAGLGSAVYSGLAVYLWYQPGIEYQLGTVFMMAAGVINVFVLRAQVLEIGVSTMVPIVLGFVAMVMGLYEPTTGGAAFWTLLIVSGFLAMFLSYALWEANMAIKRLKDVRAQLLQAQKLEALGTLTGGIAHDFNNLLSVIQGNIELVREYPSSTENDACLTDALYAAQRGATLTRQLLTLSRQATLTPRRQKPAKVLRQIQALARRVLPENIHLEVDSPENIGSVFADETLLQSALLNLIINARDAMEGGGALKITAKLLAAGSGKTPASLKRGDYIVLSVKDTGSGIPKDIIDRVSDPFFSTKPTGKGSGLGLPMVHGFAQQSGGDMQIESKPNRGTTVRLYLPARPTAAAATSSQSAAAY